MKIPRSTLADVLVIVSLIVLGISLLLPWHGPSHWILIGWERMIISYEYFQSTPPFSLTFTLLHEQLLFLSACGVGIVLFAWFQALYRVGLIFACLSFLQSVLFQPCVTWYSSSSFSWFSGYTLWLLGWLLLMSTCFIGWRRVRRRARNDDDPDSCPPNPDQVVVAQKSELYTPGSDCVSFK